MALNRYSTSSRFTDITSDDEEGKKKETNKEINERREREYAQKVAERQALLQNFYRRRMIFSIREIDR
jgi:hypothetical protein